MPTTRYFSSKIDSACSFITCLDATLRVLDTQELPPVPVGSSKTGLKLSLRGLPYPLLLQLQTEILLDPRRVEHSDQIACLASFAAAMFRHMPGPLRYSFLVAMNLFFLMCALLLPIRLWAQTDCEAGNGLLNFAQPASISVEELIRKFATAESVTKQARLNYTYKQEVLVQSLSGKDVTGEFHELTNVSYDEKGRRKEEVTFAAQNSLRDIQLTAEDLEDVRVFMPLLVTREDLPQYSLTYAGQQHVDDLDTYVFHIEPKKEQKDRRYFQGRIWVDAQDFQIVKVCGKSGPEKIPKKKGQRPDLHPTFVTYRQQVDGQYWFPAYTRSDDTLRLKAGSVRVRETIKYTGYKRISGR